MGFLSVPNLVSWLIFRALIVTDQFCWITWHTYTWQGWDKRKRRWRAEGGGGGRLFGGGDCFKSFRQSGAIIKGRRLIEGLLLFEEERYVQSRLTQLLWRFVNTVQFASFFTIRLKRRNYLEMTKLTVTARYESHGIQTNIELWKLYCPFKFLKTTIAIRDNLHQVYPSVPSFEFAVISYNVF